MSKPTETLATHPTIDDLDRLRAGLLDEEPARRAMLQRHVDACAPCRQTMDVWTRARETLNDDGIDASLAEQLRIRRQHALRGVAAARRRHPIALALAAAITAVAVGLGTLVYVGEPRNEDPASAANEGGDFYADIDFYLWLMEKQAEQNGTPRG